MRQLYRHNRYSPEVVDEMHILLDDRRIAGEHLLWNGNCVVYSHPIAVVLGKSRLGGC